MNNTSYEVESNHQSLNVSKLSKLHQLILERNTKQQPDELVAVVLEEQAQVLKKSLTCQPARKCMSADRMFIVQLKDVSIWCIKNKHYELGCVSLKLLRNLCIEGAQVQTLIASCDFISHLQSCANDLTFKVTSKDRENREFRKIQELLVALFQLLANTTAMSNRVSYKVIYY